MCEVECCFVFVSDFKGNGYFQCAPPPPSHSCVLRKHALVSWLPEYFKKYLRYFFVMCNPECGCLYIFTSASTLSAACHNCFWKNQVKRCPNNRAEFSFHWNQQHVNPIPKSCLCLQSTWPVCHCSCWPAKENKRKSNTFPFPSF